MIHTAINTCVYHQATDLAVNDAILVLPELLVIIAFVVVIWLPVIHHCLCAFISITLLNVNGLLLVKLGTDEEEYWLSASGRYKFLNGRVSQGKY